MTIPRRYTTDRLLAALILLVLLASCAPQPIRTPAGSPPQDMRQLLAMLDKHEQELQSVSRQLVDVQDQQQKQAREIDQLKRGSLTTEGSYRSALPPGTAGTTSVPAQNDGSPTEVYLQAFGDYASGRYQSAIQGFETFLQRFPNNSYASNAQFWLADCYFNQQQYLVAIREFERVLNEYTGAPKNPDALYKIAVAHLQLGATEEARRAIDTLNQRYPKSTATQKAQELVIP